MTSTTSDKWSAISKTAFLAFCLIVATLIIYEHTIHVLGVLPFVLGVLPILFVLASPLMPLFMHDAHGRGEQRPDEKGEPDHA